MARKIVHLLKETITGFMNDHAMSLSAALSYYAIFSIPPLLILVITLSGFIFGEDAVRGQLFEQINDLVGDNAAFQIQEILRYVKLSEMGTLATMISVVILLLGASAVFGEMQHAINFIWDIRKKPKKGIRKFLKNRLMAFSMIGTAGFLLMISLMLNAVMQVLSDTFTSRFPHASLQWFLVLNNVFMFIIITLLFTAILRLLPDGKVAWRDCLIGATFTAVLFMLGKLAIALYLGQSNVGTIYGVAGSVLLILLWVYYSAIILYLGVEFTKVYAMTYGKKIIPNEYTIKVPG
jgi:membrane protein